MNLSPLDIYNKEFKKSAFGGYNVSQVEDFLDKVGTAYEKLMKEINKLEDENARLKERLNNYESIENKLTQTLESVQKTAREHTKHAQKDADKIIEKANMKADKIVNEAKMKIQEERQTLEQLKETRELFRIRFKSLLESHLQMLSEEDEIKEMDLDDIAVSEESYQENQS